MKIYEALKGLIALKPTTAKIYYKFKIPSTEKTYFIFIIGCIFMQISWITKTNALFCKIQYAVDVRAHCILHPVHPMLERIRKQEIYQAELIIPEHVWTNRQGWGAWAGTTNCISNRGIACRQKQIRALVNSDCFRNT